MAIGLLQAAAASLDRAERVAYDRCILIAPWKRPSFGVRAVESHAHRGRDMGRKVGRRRRGHHERSERESRGGQRDHMPFLPLWSGRRAVLLAVAVLGVAGIAGAQNQVSGTFTVKTATTKFCLRLYLLEAELLRCQQKGPLRVAQRRAVPPEAIPKDDAGIATIGGLVRAGKVHALELHFSPRRSNWIPPRTPPSTTSGSSRAATEWRECTSSRPRRSRTRSSRERRAPTAPRTTKGVPCNTKCTSRSPCPNLEVAKVKARPPAALDHHAYDGR